MTTSTGIPARGMNLLPLIYKDPAPNTTGVTYARPPAPATDRASLIQDMHLLGNKQFNRVIFWDNDLSHPGKKAIFANEVRRNLPWIHEQSESWQNDEQSDTAFSASSELVVSINNWASAAVESSSVMEALTDLSQDPEFSAAVLPAMQQMAEAGNRAVYSVLFAFAGTGQPDALKHAGIFILADRLGVDPNRHGWMQQLGLMLAVRHLEHFEPVRVASTMEMLNDPEANPIPLSMAQDLVAKFSDLRGMEDTVHKVLREAHDYFEYFYNGDTYAAKKQKLKDILITLSSSSSSGLRPLSEDDFIFLADDLTLPVDNLLMTIAYHGQVNPNHYETLEAFAERSKWTMSAENILQVFEE